MIDVIVVEDEVAHAELIRRAFESRSDQLRLCVLSSVAEAKARLAHDCPDLLITDLLLPDGRGTELIPDDPRAADYPVVVMTSHGDESVAVEAIKSGALDYVVKTAEALSSMPHVVDRALREWRHIRELEQAQEQLHQAQKMEAIGTLASGIAHDFNNLLTGITGCSDVALSKLGADAEARLYVDEIKKAAMRGASLTRQLLAFARQRDVEPHVVDLNEVVDRARHLLRPLLTEEIDLDLELGDGQLCVRCDPSQLEQMLVNLVVNARDAMNERGRLRVTTASMQLDDDDAARVGELSGGDYVVLAVSDTGTGIDPDVLPHIFEPFFTTKEVDQGTGLGLSTIYGMVQRANGAITVDSQVGQGTTFTVYLPRKFEEPRREQSAAQQHNPEGPPDQLQRPADGQAPAPTTTLLLVEDHHTARWTTGELLSDEGFEVLQAANGAEAVELLEGYAGTVGAAICDMQLPDIHGARLARELRAIEPQLKIIFTSGRSEDDPLVQRALEHEATSFVAKPIEFDALLNRLQAILGAHDEPALTP